LSKLSTAAAHLYNIGKNALMYTRPFTDVILGTLIILKLGVKTRITIADAHILTILLELQFVNRGNGSARPILKILHANHQTGLVPTNSHSSSVNSNAKESV